MMAEIRFCRPFIGPLWTISRVLAYLVLLYSPAFPMDCWYCFETFLFVFGIVEKWNYLGFFFNSFQLWCLYSGIHCELSSSLLENCSLRFVLFCKKVVFLCVCFYLCSSYNYRIIYVQRALWRSTFSTQSQANSGEVAQILVHLNFWCLSGVSISSLGNLSSMWLHHC